MTTRSFKPLLADALDTLLSLNASTARHSIAFAQIETVIAPLALDSHPQLLNAFLHSQDSLDRNVTGGLLEWLGRTLVRQDILQGHDADQVRDNVVRCLTLIQGLLLLHRRSQRLFARKSSLQYLVAVLDLARPATVPTPLSSPRVTPHPSPVIFPTSPAFHYNTDPLASTAPSQPSPVPSQQQALAIAALDTLLCALVDRPKNMRAFEEMGGLASIVKVLKDRNVAQPVRIKVIELLYYYLLPERDLSTPTSTISSGPRSTYSADSYPSSGETMSTFSSAGFTHSQLPTMLADAADTFVPQTPTKPKGTRPRSVQSSSSDGFTNLDEALLSPQKGTSSSSASSSSSSRNPSPTRTPQSRPRGLRHKRSQSLLNFPTQSIIPSSPSSSIDHRRRLSQSISIPHSRSHSSSSCSDPESTPKPRSFNRSNRNPLEPIPASPDLSSSSKRTPRSSVGGGGGGGGLHYHRRSQSTSSAVNSIQQGGGLTIPHQSRQTTTPSTSVRTGHSSSEETAMLPPPIPLSRSNATTKRLPTPPPSTLTPTTTTRTTTVHRRSNSTSSSSSSSSSKPNTTTFSGSNATPRATSNPNPSKIPPTTTSSIDTTPVTSSDINTRGGGGGRERRQHHLRTEFEKKEMLRRVMPNVNALEERFKLMGLGM